MAKTYKTWVVHSLLERRRRVKIIERGQRSTKTPPFLHSFLGGLRNGQEVVPPFLKKSFWATKIDVLIFARTPYSKCFLEKLVATFSWGEMAMLSVKQEPPKMITVLGVFEFAPMCCSLFGFCRKTQVGGEDHPQKMREED